MVPVSRLFEVRYGVNLELNSLRQTLDGIAFVSRTARNNGVSARVAPIPNLMPLPAGTISVAGGGSVMESFLQPEPYYCGRDLYYLTAREAMTDAQKLFYCACLRANKYRFSYGRQANRTLKDILIPSPEEIPAWVAQTRADELEKKNAPATYALPWHLEMSSWKNFLLCELFDFKKGKRLTKAQMQRGNTPFIGAIDNANGVSNYVAQAASHPANTLTVSYNGSVAEAFYQPDPYRCSDDVNVLYPKFPMTPAIGLFIATLIRQEKYRFNYGRKWHLERMKISQIHLPARSDGTPDWEWMESYIKTLSFSSQL